MAPAYSPGSRSFPRTSPLTFSRPEPTPDPSRYCPKPLLRITFSYRASTPGRLLLGRPSNLYERRTQGRQPDRRPRRFSGSRTKSIATRKILGKEHARPDAGQKPRAPTRIHHDLELSDSPPLHSR